MEFQESFARHFRLIGRASRDNLPVQAIARYKLGPPGDYGRRAIAKMLRDCKFRRGVEIGTLRGESAVMWLRDNSRLHLTCIDPYDEYHSRRSQRNLDSNYEIAVETLKPYNATIIRKSSLDVVDGFENRSIDFLYIDGNHEFDPVMQDMIRWISEHQGVQDLWDYGVLEREEILSRLTRLPAAHLEAGIACYQAGRLTESEKYFQQALQLNYPLPGIPFNYLACLAADRSDLTKAMEYFQKADADLPLNYIKRNIVLLHEWLAAGRAPSKIPSFTAQYDLEFESPPEQPLLPGPIAI